MINFFQVNTSAAIIHENDHCTQKKKEKTVKPPTFTISGCFEPYPLKELISARTVLIKTIQGNQGNIWGPLKERLGIFPDGRRRTCTEQSVNWLPQPVPFEKWCCPIVVQSVYRGDGTSLQNFDVLSDKLSSSGTARKVFPSHNISDKPATHRVLYKRKMSLNLIGDGSGIPDKSTLHAGSDFDQQISKKNYSRTMPNSAETASAVNHSETALAVDKQSQGKNLVAPLKKKSASAQLKRYKQRQRRIKKRQERENRTKSIQNST